MGKRARLGDSKVAVAYVRVSTDRQELGPEAQRAAIDAWAAREGVSVIAWHIDKGVSGTTPVERRPALCAALASLREHGAGVLVVAKRDRIARDVLVSATVEREAEKEGARLLSADGAGNGTSDADGFMRDIEAARSAYERRLIASRTRAALAVKKARGERVGQVPFGYRVDGARLVPDEGEQATIATIHALRAAGKTQTGIVTELAVRGVKSRTGRPLGQTQISRILARSYV